MQPNQDTLMSIKNDNTLKNFRSLKDKEFIWEKQDIERDHRNFVDKSLDTKSRAKNNLSERTLQDGLLINKLSSFLKKVKFSEQEFPTSKSISNIKYHHSSFQNKKNYKYNFTRKLAWALIFINLIR